MKQTLFILTISLQLSSCVTNNKTDENAVKKVVTTTEFLLLDKDFDKLDSIHQQKTVFKYDANNNKLEEMTYWGPQMTPGGGVVYKYDNTNRLVEEYDDKGSKSEWEYSNNNANEFERVGNKKVKWQSIYFDSKHNMIRKTRFANGEILSDSYFKYDSKNNLIQITGTYQNKKLPTNFKLYDSLSNLIENKSVDENNIVTYYEQFSYLKFDTKGNWLVRKSIFRNEPHSLTFQKIDYK